MPLQVPLANVNFSLDPTQIAGFLGADAALAAMMLPHIHGQRKWWGWYNCPGSYYLAKRYGQLARLKFWSPSYQSSAVPQDLADELTGVMGPTYTAARSGATLQSTGPLASMLVEECRELESVEVGGRHSAVMDVAIVKLKREPEELEYPRVPHTLSRRLAILPILVTMATGIACYQYGDFYSAAVIFFSALCHGIACQVMGNTKFTYQHRIPQQTARLASGWLEASRSFVVLCGTEAAVAPITRGRFSLQFDESKGHGSREHRIVTGCSILLGIQFLLQLLLVPQGGLFGQTMFIASVVAAWFYHRLVLAHGKETVERRILMSDVLGKPTIEKFRFGTRTAAAVFAVLALRPHIGEDVEARLQALLPKDTPVWQLWHRVVAQKITLGQPLRFEECDWEWQKMRGLWFIEDSLLFITLLKDAETAYAAYTEHLPKTDLLRPAV